MSPCGLALVVSQPSEDVVHMSCCRSIKISVHILVVFMSILCARRDPYLSASLLRWMVNDTRFCHHHKLLPHVYMQLLYKRLILC